MALRARDHDRTQHNRYRFTCTGGGGGRGGDEGAFLSREVCNCDRFQNLSTPTTSVVTPFVMSHSRTNAMESVVRVFWCSFPTFFFPSECGTTRDSRARHFRVFFSLGSWVVSLHLPSWAQMIKYEHAHQRMDPDVHAHAPHAPSLPHAWSRLSRRNHANVDLFSCSSIKLSPQDFRPHALPKVTPQRCAHVAPS